MRQPSPGSTSMDPIDAVFERKVRLSSFALFFERMWPRMWALLGLGGLFTVLSLLGFWPRLSEGLHKLTLAVFVIAAIGLIIFIGRTPWPARDEALRRLERRSGVPHRPASAYEDSLTETDQSPETGALWQAHRARLAALLARLKVGNPSPRTDRFDPFAVRALLIAGIALLAIAVGDSAADRLRAAFRFGVPLLGPDARLDAWVTPPVYTGRAPVILADGSRPAGTPVTGPENGVYDVPESSVLIVRATGAKGFVIEFTPDGKPTQRIEAKAPPVAASSGTAQAAPVSDVAEAKLDLKSSSKVQITGQSGVAPWVFRVIPDNPPKIALIKDPERMPRGALKLTYKMEDDYGVVSAEGRITRAPAKAGDPAKSWARAKANTGPRPPLERPPVLTLRLPRANARQADSWSYHELGGHPWAGTRVRLQLQAKDHAGQTGRSEPYEFVLPQRRFDNPVAKAVVEQRRLLVEDPRNRARVLEGLAAITLEPEEFPIDARAYLGLRSAYFRLERDKSRTSMKSVVDQLWNVALRLEDGNLTDAERALREAQEKLSKALQDGASDEEIKKLMAELRQALNQFIEQLARQGGEQPQQGAENKVIRQQDLDRMMRDIENMARQGSRDTAQQMLSQLRDLLEQLQNGRMAQGQGNSQQSQQMMQMMDQFGDIIGKQQQLLDDTFGEQQRQDGQPGQKPGQQGQQGQRGQRGQRGEGRNPQAQGNEPGQNPGQNPGELGRRQGELRGRMGELRDKMQKFGMAPPQLNDAERSMQEAEQALRNGDLDGASKAEQQALDQLRQGAQAMAEQMMRQGRQFGQGPGSDAPLDPMGRPQRSEGPDFGNSVKIPDEIDVQRAREILEELRRRMGEPSRTPLELDYIDRLLRRF